MKSLRRMTYAVLFVGTVAAAQPDSSQPSPLPPAAKAPPNVTSPAEMRANANTITIEIKADYQHILRLQEIARKQKDVIKLNCVNDKLVQVKAQMNIAETGAASLRGALDKGGGDAQPLYEQVSASGNTIKELREAANGCIGETELSKKDSGVDVTRPDIPDDPGIIDPTKGDVVSVEPPAYASPYH